MDYFYLSTLLQYFGGLLLLKYSTAVLVPEPPQGDMISSK